MSRKRIFEDHALTPSEKNKRYYENHKEKSLARNAQFYRDNREAQAKRHRNNRHGINQEWFDSKMVEQDGKCAICRKPFEETPHIDHNHECCSRLKSCDKCRRGLLCDDCNLGLGRFKDSIDRLSKAIKYLQGWE